MIAKKTFSGEVSPGGSAPSHQKGHRAARPKPRGEEPFWDQMWWLGCGYLYRHAANTVCNYVPQHVESAFPNTYSTIEASFKININYLLSIFPPTSPVWLMLTIKNNGGTNNLKLLVFISGVLWFIESCAEAISRFQGSLSTAASYSSFFSTQLMSVGRP